MCLVKLKKKLVLFICCIGLTGCATQMPTHSGFLDNYGALQPLSGKPLVLVTRSPQPLNLARVLIAPVTIINGHDTNSLSDTERDQLCHFLQQTLVNEFKTTDNPIVTEQPTIVIRAMITEVHPAKPILNVLTTLTLFVPFANGGVSIEIEAVEQKSGKRLAAMSAASNGSLSEFSGYFHQYRHVEQGLEQLTQQFHQLLTDRFQRPSVNIIAQRNS